MVAEDAEEYRPYDTLKSIGFTKDEARGFLANIEQNASTQLPPEAAKAPDIEVRFRAQQTKLRSSRFKKLLLIVWGYAFAVWMYVIAVQLLHPAWIYLPFATWLPVRTDYVGEIAFGASFIIVTAVTMWNTKQTLPDRRQLHPD